VTDGPVAESKEVLAGYWAIDVETEARAHYIAIAVTGMRTLPFGSRRPSSAPTADILAQPHGSWVVAPTQS
jgi:hypothetical protein